ncbi:MAG TPA: tellurite resistance TerB family protein [Hyphomicrobiaceae bacterium]|nr:tellurite resistance TerB family protein [Hyphomicrobiaceae bacterium]
MPDKLTPQQALIYALITTAASDNALNDIEMRRIGWVVKELPAFLDFDETRLIEEAQACAKVVSGPDGLNVVLDLIARSLPDSLRETAYVLAAEVAVADLKSSPEERRYLQLLAQRLKLDQLTVAALTRAAIARHRIA